MAADVCAAQETTNIYFTAISRGSAETDGEVVLGSFTGPLTCAGNTYARVSHDVGCTCSVGFGVSHDIGRVDKLSVGVCHDQVRW